MTHKVYVVTDLGPGDGGKGGVVHKIATMRRVHTIVKRGGAQGNHGVVTSRGENFGFAEWGCGTFEGVPTFIPREFVMYPEALIPEANALRYEHGVQEPFDLLTVDEEALCATSYHQIASRIKELARGKNPRGTVGTGVGEAFRDAKLVPDLAIRIRDLLDPTRSIRERLMAVRRHIQTSLQPIIEAGTILPEDQAEAQEQIAQLVSNHFLMNVVDRMKEAVENLRIVNHDYFAEKILPQDGVVVVEASHGVLTDSVYGFLPHTSALRTLPYFTHKMFIEAGYDGPFVNIGVHRAYNIRHGAGPMPTADEAMTNDLFPPGGDREDRYRGRVHVGPLDLVLLRYAIDVCGGPSVFDGLAITWFDHVQARGVWPICERYHVFNHAFFSDTGRIRVMDGAVGDQRAYQEALTRELRGCVPYISNVEVPSGTDREAMYVFCADFLKDRLGVPVRMVAFGPTEDDKICH